MGWGSRGCDVCGAGDTRLVAMSLRREDHSKVRGQQRPQGPGIHAEGAAHSGEAARGSRTRERDTMEFMFLNVVGGGLWIRGGSRQTPRRPDASWESLGQVLVLHGTNTLSPPCLKRGCGGGHFAQLWLFASQSVLQTPLPSGDEPQVGREKSGGAQHRKGAHQEAHGRATGKVSCG